MVLLSCLVLVSAAGLCVGALRHRHRGRDSFAVAQAPNQRPPPSQSGALSTELRRCVGTEGGIRTHTDRFLKPVPLPRWATPAWNGQGGWIRTNDLFGPKEELCQTELHPDVKLAPHAGLEPATFRSTGGRSSL